MKNLKLILTISGVVLLLGICLSFREVKTAQTKYEYIFIQSVYASKVKINVVSNGTVVKESISSATAVDIDLSVLLNEYGSQGWELVSCDRKGEERIFYFKRPLE